MSEINTVLLGDFIDESSEHLDEMESLLLQLSNDLGNDSILNDIFRMIHNVKGAAQITGLDKVSRISHRFEDLLDLLRQGQVEVTPEIISLLIVGRDRIVELVSELARSSQELSSVDELIDQLDILMGDGQLASSESEQDVATENLSVQSPAESFDELDDKELFDIYIGQLREQYSLLSLASAQFGKTIVDVEQLGACRDAVIKLNSSAAYMGYEDIVDLSDQWFEDLNTALSNVLNGEQADLDFMDTNLDFLKMRFPPLVEYGESEPEAEKEKQEDGVVAMDDDITSAVLGMFQNDEIVDSSVEEAAEIADDKIESPMLNDFIHEARGSLEKIESLLARISTDTDLTELSQAMYNIRVAAQLISLDKTPRLCQYLEDLLGLLQQKELDTDRTIVELLIEGYERIETLLNELDQFQQELSAIDDLVEMLASVIRGGSSAPRIELSALNEEHDQELFDIFIAHLSQQLALISFHVKQSKEGPSDRQARLRECIRGINNLHSSANYMGYEELSHYYQRWIDEIEKSLQLKSQGEQVSLDIVDAYIGELVRVFPQINQVSVEAEVEEPVMKKPALAVVAEEPANGTGRDEALFDRMNNALELSLQQSSASEHETLNEVFDELVSAQQSEPPAPEQPSAEAAVSGSVQSLKKAKDRTRFAQRIKDGREQGPLKGNEASDKKVRKSVRVDAEKIDMLMNQVGELVVDRSYFFQLFNEMRELQQQLKEKAGIDQKEVKLIRAFTYRLGEAISGLGRTSSELQEGVMKMRMLPVSHLFNRYPRLVHDLTNKLDKKVNLILRGEETELDRMIVEELSDPLIHIIRNSVDHGIESPEERQRVGKVEEGKLILEAFQESNHIVIQVTDDGCGLDPEKIRQKAISNGLYTREEVERLSEHEVFNLILMPGFSTADQITGTSGRGVGMDVVKKNIEKLNGMLDIDSKIGKGTQMRLKIPLTLAIIHALMVRVGNDMFTIPLANVDETVRISRGDTSLVEGVEVIYLRGVALPVFRLSKLFKVSSDVTLEKSFVVIVNTDGQRIGFVVDELLGQEEVVIKPLEDYVQERSGFSGATVVGDGRISLILDVYELVKVTTRQQNLRQKKQAEMLKMAKPRLAVNSGG